jgi:hypothetical protein
MNLVVLLDMTKATEWEMGLGRELDVSMALLKDASMVVSKVTLTADASPMDRDKYRIPN